MKRSIPSQRCLCILLLVLSVCTQLVACIPTLVAGTATGASVAIDRLSTGVIIDDQTIELGVTHELAKTAFWGKSHIVAVSYNNQVLLIGQVPNPAAIQQASQISSRINGVRKVFNQLHVGEPSSFGTRTNDTYLTSKVRSGLLTKDSLKSHAIKVVTEESTVYLMGIVTQQEANLATDVARHVSGVKHVVRVFEYTKNE